MDPMGVKHSLSLASLRAAISLRSAAARARVAASCGEALVELVFLAQRGQVVAESVLDEPVERRVVRRPREVNGGVAELLEECRVELK